MATRDRVVWVFSQHGVIEGIYAKEELAVNAMKRFHPNVRKTEHGVWICDNDGIIVVDWVVQTS